MLFRLASILLLLVWGIGFANEDLRIGDSCYFSRAENAIDDKADLKNVDKIFIFAYINFTLTHLNQSFHNYLFF